MTFGKFAHISANSLLICSLFLTGCSESKKEPSEAQQSQFTLLNPDETGIEFSNSLVEDAELNPLEWDALYYGGGVAAGDINKDGLTDLFFTGNQAGDRLYLNKGEFKFQDITEASGISAHPGWSTGVAMMDFDGDGLLDVYVCRSGWKQDQQDSDKRKNKLFLNNGDLTFREAAQEFGLDNEGYSTQMAFLDYDHDGDLDLFLLNAPSNNLKQKVAYQKTGFPDFAADRFFRNDGSGKFTDVSKESGVYNHAYGLGVIACDLDHDGWVDIYVANDYERPDFMYINQRNGTFKNMLNLKVKHTPFTAMGVDAGDINNDALVDFAVLDMQSDNHFRSKTNMPSMSTAYFMDLVDRGFNHQYMTNVLQLNHGTGFFSDIAQMAGVASTDWSWSVLLTDLDNDGYRDIHITNGINRDIRNNDFAMEFEAKMARGESIDLLSMSQAVPSTQLANFAYQNNQNLTFSNKGEEWGLNQLSFSYGTALADLNNDGNLDLVINNNNAPPFVYRNNNPHKNNHFRIRIDGQIGNLHGEGVKAIVFCQGQKQYAELTTVRGYQSASEPVIHFGLGKNELIDSLLIIFPDQKTIKDYRLAANQTKTYAYNSAAKNTYRVYQFGRPFFVKSDPVSTGLDFIHVENDFNEFNDQLLLPHEQGAWGPTIASGDFNGDGLDGIYAGGAAGHSGGLFQQAEFGKFERINVRLFEEDEKFEDTCALFFDADNDGDLDLFVGSGGGHLPGNDQGYADRLYVNDGNGNYSKSKRLPPVYLNTSAVAAADIDNDGFPELIVGSRGMPGRYPMPEGIRVYKNEKGFFSDATSDFCPDCMGYGMVSSMVADDFDGNGSLDVAVCGEWGSPALFYADGGTLKQKNIPLLDSLSGWWFAATTADIDGDGRQDLLLGNVGLNTKFHPSMEKPLKVYAGDMDDNGSHDIVLSKKFQGVYVPLRGRQCSSEQVPMVSEKFKDFASFAAASLEDVYGENLKKAFFAEVNEFSSGVLLNKSSGWQFIPFPNIAQISATTAFVARDFNKDGITDVLMAGNHFDAEVETTRHDASNGLLLLGKGDGTFQPLQVLESGFYAPLNVKSMVMITNPLYGDKIIVGNNNAPFSIFGLNP